jgi:hypothetical protein
MAEGEEAQRLYAVVGELVLTAAGLDDQLNRICIKVLNLGEAIMTEPVVASLDARAKIEILKENAKKISQPIWKKALKDHLEALEKVNKWRNIASHSIMSFKDGHAVLSSMAAAKLLKSIDLASKTATKTKTADLEKAILIGREAFATGENLIANFGRVATEFKRRKIT